ncbi:hypothetical protein [Nodularia spumigena]|uniref:hypothetical protein n=1 Tax=Nodularia spumigena TaxID=70799 RepID=UPI0000EACD7A|nr:hypothetical protein [Nodularia spumigena]AHJ29964.1 hypothetical protein NSP_36610 [Nodularia spumigena CCY9414]EAW44853.1 hypothetical protein N9414_19859 [Nodularia spumigena CCY9414]
MQLAIAHQKYRNCKGLIVFGDVYRSVTIPLLASVFAVDIILLLVVAQLLEGEIWKVSHAFPGVLGLAVLQKCVFGH